MAHTHTHTHTHTRARVSTTGPTLRFKLESCPDPDEDFFINCASEVNLFHEKLANGSKLLVRGPPASGKSTLARAMRRAYPFNCTCGRRSYVYLSAVDLQESAQNITEMTSAVAKILNSSKNLAGALPLEESFQDWCVKNEVAIIIDEAHLIFNTK